MTRRATEPLTVRLPPALAEFLRREAARHGISPPELARQLLMRGLHSQRLDDVIRDLCPDCDAPQPSSEAMIAAQLEAGAVLGALPASRAASRGSARRAAPADPRETMRHAIDRAARRNA